MNTIIIVGAGITGLATAMKLLQAKPQLNVIVLEKEKGPAMHQTGNNSGVIHAGVYYRPGSLKAQNCRIGYEKLIGFCQAENIKYELCGKLIVATSNNETERLDNLLGRAKQNGLHKVVKIRKEQIAEYEPHASGIAALHVPYTGIVDYKEVAAKYAEIITQRLGGKIYYNSKLTKIIQKTGGIEAVTANNTFNAMLLINTAGLHSDKIAQLTGDDPGIRIIPFRGEYTKLSPEAGKLVNSLIYPVPNPDFPFLGVHFTRLIHGGIEAGPNAVWAFAREGYKFFDFSPKNIAGDLAWPGFRKVMRQYWKTGLGEYWRSFNKYALAHAMQKLVPEITPGSFKPAGSGVRAQACGKNGGLIDDFIIHENKWAINVLNAPSPAATASLAIGEAIAQQAIKRL
ncbi:MAG: L-2-hydroxyglutarate oxidase [Bacteroidales bacterium]|nr:L-2-hydroxyglutarate oxidase [Bacteroidales bacterium]